LLIVKSYTICWYQGIKVISNYYRKGDSLSAIIWISFSPLPTSNGTWTSVSPRPFVTFHNMLVIVWWGIVIHPAQPQRWRTIPCWLSATAYSIHLLPPPYMKNSTFQNLRMCQAEVTREGIKAKSSLICFLHLTHDRNILTTDLCVFRTISWSVQCSK
jgi:hypothetical protein